MKKHPNEENHNTTENREEEIEESFLNKKDRNFHNHLIELGKQCQKDPKAMSYVRKAILAPTSRSSKKQ